MSIVTHGRAESIRQRIRNRFPKQQEAKTLEFKSTLRWNLREERKEPKVVTHVIDVNHSCRWTPTILAGHSLVIVGSSS